jgi:PAS domain S-box-containing protein
MATLSIDQLIRENEQLRQRLEDAEETLRALRAGEVDAVLVESGGEQVLTLEQADKPYRLLVEQMPCGAATLTAEGAIISCNSRFAERIGRSLNTLLGKPIKQFAAAESQRLLESLLRDGIAGAAEGPVVLQRADGTSAPLYLGISALQEGVLGTCLMVTDLTEQRHYESLQRIQQTLHESERRFRDMIDALPAAVYTTDAQGRLTHFNPACVGLSGRTPVVGSDHWCVTWRLYRPDGTPLPHGECAMAISLKEGRAVRGAETIAERPDGTRAWFMPYPTPLRDAEGRIVGGINMLVDITERKRAEQATAALAAIVDSSDDAIVGKDLNGVIASFNKSAERMFGYTAQEAIGQPVTLVIPKDRLSEEAEILRRLRQGERVDHFETVRVRKDGSLIDISLTVSPIKDAAGRVVGASKIARDITDRKKTEAALREADRRKDEFLATLAHELRNPLAPIRNAVQILRANDPSHAELDWSRGVLHRQVQVLERLLDDLLDVSRISRNKLDLRIERVELSSVLHAALETSHPLIEVRGHELIVDLPREPICVRADPVRLAQVFSNLLHNAAKYTAENGRIWLTAERRGGEAVVSVKDTGIGIAAEMLPHLFEIFAQAKPALELSQGGLGIGLSLVKGLVELHGGSVEAGSDGPGWGSRFVIRLPIASETFVQEPDRTHEKEDNVPANATNRRILIVDDYRDSADSMARLLKVIGFEVGTAYNGQQAVERAAELRPDVVLLDIGMPKMNGYEACRRIREQPWGQKMLLIALTGWGQEEDRRQTEEAGFDQHLVKPVDTAILLKLLAAWSP